MKLIKKHIIGLFLTLLVTGTVILPLAHDVYHAQLYASQLAEASNYQPQHTHPSRHAFGNQCHQIPGADTTCLLCTLAPILAIPHNAAGAPMLDVTVAGYDVDSIVPFLPPLLFSIRGPPMLV